MASVLRMAAGLAVSVAALSAHAAWTGPDTTQGDAERVRSDETVDLTSPTLFVVGYAHLDTQWRWPYFDTIRDFIPATMTRNFVLFDKYPDYVFNFGGSRRYEMMEEYYPEDFARLKGYVTSGRWFPCGSSVDENDANTPSAESQIRHALYGNRYFLREFGVASDEFMLPDCFGFPASLPSVLAHCGIKGFSTQKLTWNSVVPIPFKVGVWEGPDGSSVIAALDPGSYVGQVREDLSDSDSWYQRIKNNGDESGVYVDYHYYGTGDTGGAPRESSVAMVQQSVDNGKKDDARIHVISAPADHMYNAISAEERAKLPTYKGELELTQHSAGSVTSQAYMKRWNRKNELLADAAEKAAVGAWKLGGGDYPAARLERAWGLVLGSQMHDIIPGTSVPLAYDLSWNDEVIAANQFGAMLTEAARAVISGMDTQGPGTSIVVFNPVSWERADVVEADVPYSGAAPKGATVTGPDGARTAAQVLSAEDGTARVAFVASVPSVGFAAYSVELSNAVAASTGLSVSADGRTLENEHYTVKINEHGDVASIYDKAASKELLRAPARIGLYYENPSQWPAWNQDWEDRVKPAQAFVGAEGPVSIRVIENGPARVAVEIVRGAEGSTFTQHVRLAKGGDRVEFDTIVDWNTRERSVRAEFPLTASNPTATFDLQAGAIERGNGHEKQYEYGFHQWFDLTDKSGDFGATVMCDSKYGSDKPDDGTVRLTLLYTPGVRGGYPDQATQDIGRHHITYAVQGHTGDWRKEHSYAQAAQLNQPLVPFRTAAHSGGIGKTLSLVQVSDPRVSVSALKKAEDSNEVIVRLREHSGESVRGVRVSGGAPLLEAREVDGQERPLGGATVRDGALVTDIHGYGLRAFAVKLADVKSVVSTRSAPLALDFDTDAISANANRADGAMTAGKESYPAEQIPQSLEIDGVSFKLGSGKDAGTKNALTAHGQEIKLPAGTFNRVYVLAASSDGDVTADWKVGSKTQSATVEDWGGYVGQWDRREWPGDVNDPRYPWGSHEPIGLTPGFVKQGEIGWYVSHHHTPADGGSDALYRYCYMFKVGLDVPAGATSITLPNDSRIKVFAVTAANQPGAGAVPAAPLFDTLDGHKQGPPSVASIDGPAGADGVFTDTVAVNVAPGLYWSEGSIHYTTDGSTPTAHSPVVEGPITLNKTATVKVAAQTADGKVGPAASKQIRVDDSTAPRVEGVLAVYQTPKLSVSFSEPVAKLTPANIRITPPIEIKGVTMSPDQRTAIVALAAAPKVDTGYTVRVANVKDTSPAANSMDEKALQFSVPGPVFSLDKIGPDMMGKSITDVEGLPVKGSDPWTMNVFVKMDKQPVNRTPLVGFGECAQGKAGGARYIVKFANGVHFWSHNQDSPGSEQYDLNRWQMITCTYDGSSLKVYKDGKLIGDRAVRLADDRNVINIAPLDPWDRRYRFEGELAGLTIWDAALTQEAIQTLEERAPE